MPLKFGIQVFIKHAKRIGKNPHQSSLPRFDSSVNEETYHVEK